MKKSFLKIFALLLFFNLFSCQSAGYEVIIKVEAPELEDTSKIYIAGNLKEIGAWNPASVQLEYIGNKTWQKIFMFPANTMLEFKFTKGSWSNEALTNEKSIPRNCYLKVEHDTTFQTKIIYWKFGDEEEKVFKGQITGKVDYYRNLKYKFLKPRDLVVWLPPSYEDNLNDRYPVLYMHDGQNIFDPETSFGGIDWQIDEAADSLIRNNDIEPMIIVGIYNTIDRNSEYRYNDTGFVYMDFVINKVKPLIDNNYRTKPDRANTASGGSSLGGLISFMMVWEHPDVFSKTISMSPALKIQDIDYVSTVGNYAGAKKDIQMYIYNGGIGLEKRLQPGIDDMLNLLISMGYKLEEDLYFRKDINSEHNETAWAKRIPDALKLFFDK